MGWVSVFFYCTGGMTRLRGQRGISPDFFVVPQISSAQEGYQDFLTKYYGDFYRFITEGFPTFTELIRTAGKPYLAEVKNLAESKWFWIVKKPRFFPPPLKNLMGPQRLFISGTKKQQFALSPKTHFPYSVRDKQFRKNYIYYQTPRQ